MNGFWGVLGMKTRLFAILAVLAVFGPVTELGAGDYTTVGYHEIERCCTEGIGIIWMSGLGDPCVAARDGSTVSILDSVHVCAPN